MYDPFAYMRHPAARARASVSGTRQDGGAPRVLALMRVRLLALLTFACLPACVLAQPVGAAPTRPQAKAALSEKYVKEQGHLHFTSKGGGAAIAEQGSATGTFNASLSINLLVKVSTVTGSFTAYLKGGSISGYASAVPHVSGQWVSFKGSITIKHGTGAYAGASGTAGLYGSLNRNSLKLNVQLIGRLRI